MAGETSRQGAQREVLEELGLSLDFTGVRPVVTVNFDGGFDDFYGIRRDVSLEELHLQKEEVSAVRWASLQEVLALLEGGQFLGYPAEFLRLLFQMQDIVGFFPPDQSQKGI